MISKPEINKNGSTINEVGATRWVNENGQLHREDGPAVEYLDGRKYWWYNARRINCNSQEEFERIINLLIFE